MLTLSKHASVEKLCNAWRETELIVTLPGMAAFAASPSLLNKIRGALGLVLLASASQNVLDRKACAWSRPATADLFFGHSTSVRLGDHDSSIARPFVLFGLPDRSGALEIHLRIFGLATSRSDSVFDALIAALCHHVDWSAMKGDGPRYLPSRIVPSKVVTRSLNGIPRPEGEVEKAEMLFLSAIDSDRGNPIRQPSLILERLVRRAALIAPWFEVSLAEDYGSLIEMALKTKIGVEDGSSIPTPTKGGHHRANVLAPPMRLALSHIQHDFWSMLMIGERCHVGRGASIGLGRYRLTIKTT